MQINLKSNNLELSDSIYEYVNKKIGELDKLVQKMDNTSDEKGEKDTVQVDVEVGRTTNHHKKGDEIYRAEINVTVPGAKKVIRVESKQHDLHLAIDEAKDGMQRRLKRYKSKKRTKFQRGIRKMKKITRLSRLARRRDEEL
ncbi:MAG: ribosome-associated translation inhibitor RaiA [Candidatus Spechtbacterales bacterium]|nr:ribosome-associated translation inhibitor RaiA [Candidatus Spechtbacterales bacterium]